MKHKNNHTDALILPDGKGRVYNCGTMTAIFKADENETNEKYSISEWWLEPNSDGPGEHQHEDNDEVFYVLEGTISIMVGDKWIDWLAVFLSLFWLREVFNLAMSIAFELISPDGSFFSGDEVYISRGLGLWEGTIPLLLGALGILVSAYVIFRIIPPQIRLTFFVSGLLGGGLGFVLWVDILGPILLP
jgi:hypothetical protein